MMDRIKIIIIMLLKENKKFIRSNFFNKFKIKYYQLTNIPQRGLDFHISSIFEYIAFLSSHWCLLSLNTALTIMIEKNPKIKSIPMKFFKNNLNWSIRPSTESSFTFSSQTKWCSFGTKWRFKIFVTRIWLTFFEFANQKYWYNCKKGFIWIIIFIW